MFKKTIFVVVGSTNPIKIKAVNNTFKKFYTKIKVSKIQVNSGVSIQPRSIKEAYQGAFNRATNALQAFSLSDFGVGIEGTLQKYVCGWATCGVVVICNRQKQIGVGISPQLFLPKRIVGRLKEKQELGNIIKEISRGKYTKKTGGAFGFFTNNIVSRQKAYEQAVAFALSRFIKTKLWQ